MIFYSQSPKCFVNTKAPSNPSRARSGFLSSQQISTMENADFKALFPICNLFLCLFLSFSLSSALCCLILVYCTFLPSSVITNERGNYASCHLCVGLSPSRSLSLRLVVVVSVLCRSWVSTSNLVLTALCLWLCFCLPSPSLRSVRPPVAGSDPLCFAFT